MQDNNLIFLLCPYVADLPCGSSAQNQAMKIRLFISYVNDNSKSHHEPPLDKWVGSVGERLNSYSTIDCKIDQYYVGNPSSRGGNQRVNSTTVITVTVFCHGVMVHG